ncbi:5525_t:CDS:2, partial [Diversispora eburnea]
LSAFGTLGSLIWSGSRVIVTAGYRSYFPVFSDKLQKISKRETPMNALLFQFILGAIVIILIGGAHRNSFQVLYSMAQYASWFFYGLIGIGLIRIRYCINNESGFWWWIIIFIYIACSLYITVVSFVGTSDLNNDCSIPRVGYYLPNGISLGFLVIGARTR